ncbi:MAG TPA: adenylate/guanylate cyclase domain-containing protein [Solirubrobacterales bacterium]|nr:adenylate/guanylate cyclase domain-containing protein [Solirubrobacterales bacterium]
MEVETRYADSDGVSIAYQVHEGGPLDLVFVPGFVSHVELYWDDPATARFLRRLTSFARVVIWDKREQGLSDRTGRPPTLEDSMDDLKAVMEAAGCERPAILGVSEGGPMSMLFAATHPDRVSTLVLFGAFARILAAPDFAAGMPEDALERWGEMMKRDWGGAVGVDLWAPSVLGDAQFERWWARLLRFGSSPSGAISLMDLYREIDVRPVLPAIDVPTLILQRRGDRIARVGQGRYLAQAIPGAKYVEFEGEDHLPIAGDQDALLDEVEEFLVGSRRGSEPERALATVLFTDIVGSTEKAAGLGDRGWRQLIERHDAAVRRQLSLYRGREVKTMGDGFLATFDGPARAIRCAAALQGEVEGLGVELRAGIHTGEVELIGEDVGGMAVNIGARIGALAGPGEVLVSSTVRELVVGSGLEFADRGVRSLKGAPGEWRLFAVDSPPS